MLMTEIRVQHFCNLGVIKVKTENCAYVFA